MKQRVLAIAAASLLPAILLSTLWLFRPVRAATFDVCAIGCPYTTISQAVDDLGNVPDGSIINVFAGTYTDTVVVTRTLTIQGQGAGVTIVDGGGLNSVFSIANETADITVTIKNLTIQNGVSIDGGGISNERTAFISDSVIQNNEAPNEGGGGILNFGGANMTLQRVTIISNTAAFGAGIFNDGVLSAENITITLNHTSLGTLGDTGGGIENSGVLNLTNSVVSNNSAKYNGGGIENAGTLTVSLSAINANSSDSGTPAGGGGISNIVGGTTTIISSTISANSADFGGGINNEGTLWVTSSVVHDNVANSGNGGGIRNESGGVLTVTNSTVGGNGAVEGGGLFNEGSGATAVLRSSTFYNNSGSFAGNIYNITGTVTLSNTIIAIPLLGADCFGSGVISDGSNLDSDGSCGLGAGELSAIADPKIGPLQDNGGPTWTYALLLTSPAIDAANACEATDQRGIARPVGNGCDIGAYETAVYRINLPAILKK